MSGVFCNTAKLSQKGRTQSRGRDHANVFQSSGQSKNISLPTHEHNSTVPEGVARLIHRVRKSKPLRKGQHSLDSKQQPQPLHTCPSDSELLLFERKGHLLTRAHIATHKVDNLAKVNLQHVRRCDHRLSFDSWSEENFHFTRVLDFIGGLVCGQGQTAGGPQTSRPRTVS